MPTIKPKTFDKAVLLKITFSQFRAIKEVSPENVNGFIRQAIENELRYTKRQQERENLKIDNKSNDIYAINSSANSENASFNGSTATNSTENTSRDSQ